MFKAGRHPAPDVRLDRDSHYQLANRLAFKWKLATLGIPVVLLYFTGRDEGIADAGEPILDDAHWQALSPGHAFDVGVASALVGASRMLWASGATEQTPTLNRRGPGRWSSIRQFSC